MLRVTEPRVGYSTRGEQSGRARADLAFQRRGLYTRCPFFNLSEPCSAVTLSDEVFEALVKDILSGVVEPGARLDEPSICRKYGVSRTPIREALRRLSGAGLVEVAPRKGVTVAQIDVEQLNNMFEALAEFEGLCSRLSAVRMTTLEKRRLEVLNASRQKRIADGEKDFAGLNNEFHEFIYRGAHNSSIASVARGFRQRLAPFRALQFVPGYTEYSFHEHDQIVAAIVASDTERAHSLMRDHITGVALQVIEHFTQRGASVTSKPSSARQHSSA
ncbi:MAG: GntR family transcriptional regulator [Hyphomicrobiales bacterium]|nr:GntR family transcriptional regulator [Hyphomicrobiales bacterium]